MANTTWNPADKTANVTLGGTNNLRATSTGSGGGVRTIDNQTAGQYYWEVTGTTWANTQTGMGIANTSTALATVAGATWANACAVQHSGNIWLNGAAPPGSPNLGARAAGDVIGIAIDLTAKLAWFRVAPSGNWNGSGTASPGGTGGISITAISAATIFPLWAFVAAGDVATANFGDTAFSGAVPSGYTAGFPAGGSGGGGGTTQARAMVLA